MNSKWKETPGTGRESPSRKDLLFIPDTLLSRAAAFKPTEQMARQQWLMRTLPNVVPAPANDKSVASIHTHLPWSGAQIFPLNHQLGEQILPNFSFCQQELLNRYAQLTQAAPIAFKFGLKPNYISPNNLCPHFWTVFNLSHFFLFLLEYSKNFLAPVRIIACSSRIILSTIHKAKLIWYILWEKFSWKHLDILF